MEMYSTNSVCLATFAQQKGFEVNPCCSVCQGLLLRSVLSPTVHTTVCLSFHLRMDICICSTAVMNKAAAFL